MSLEQDLNLVRKIAWKHAKKSGMDFDDLFSEGCIAYLEAESKWDDSKGARSTFFYNAIHNHIINILKRENIADKRINSVNDDFFAFFEVDENHEHTFQPETHYLEKEKWDEFVQHLSPEAQAMCEIIINDNSIFLPLDAPRLCRGVIKDAMRNAGWSWSKIWKGFAELKAALN